MNQKTFLSRKITLVISIVYSAFCCVMYYNYKISHQPESKVPYELAHRFWVISFSRFCFDFFWMNHCLLILPIATLIAFCRGKAFNLSAVKNLHLIAYYLLLITPLYYLEDVITLEIMSDKLFIRPISHTRLPLGWYWWFLTGVLVLIIARVFKRQYLRKGSGLSIIN